MRLGDTPHRTATGARRRAAAVALALALALVAAACSSGDDGPRSAASSSSTSTTAPAPTACRLLDPRDLSRVTGIEFDHADPAGAGCIYTSAEGLAAITLNVTKLGGTDPAAAIEESTQTCDPGSVRRLTFPGAQGGFRCTVKGVASVGVTGGDVFAVLFGATLRSEVPTDRILDDLATILQHALRP